MSESPVAAVLGAAGGIGSALSQQLREDGFRLVLGSRLPEPGPAPSGTEHHFQCEATDAASVESFFKAAGAACGRLDAVAVCVGSLLLKPATRTTIEEWDHTIATNLTSAFLAIKFAVPHLAPRGGSIVLVSSAAATRGLANHEAIAGAKAGVIGLARSAAASYATKGIRVNCVAPGLTETPMTRHLVEHDASRKASIAMHPLGRLGTPEDIAGAIAWLLNPRQGWITGQVLGVDGGLAALGPRNGRA